MFGFLRLFLPNVEPQSHSKPDVPTLAYHCKIKHDLTKTLSKPPTNNLLLT